MKIRRTQIRRITEDLLNGQRVEGPPVNVEKILHDMKIQLRIQPGPEDISGFLVKTGTQPAIIGVNSSHHRNRQRFTMAHELGHMLLHDFTEVHVDRAFLVKLRNAESSKGEDWEEIEANLFAAELLMPKRFLERDLAETKTLDLHDEESLKRLAQHYAVSPQALTVRLGYLGFPIE